MISMRDRAGVGASAENRAGGKRLICRISLFVLFLSQVFLFLTALTNWDQASFLFATHRERTLGLLALCLTILGIGLWQGFGRLLDGCPERLLKCGMAAGVFLAFLLQLYFLLHVRNLYLFDNAFVTGGASTLATGDGVAEQARYYFSVYPNQNAYIVLTAALWRLGTLCGLGRSEIPMLLNAVNLLFLDTTFGIAYLLFDLLERRRGLAGRAGFLALMLLNPFLYIGVCYYYTITLSMPFFMGLLYLYLKYFRGEGRVPAFAWGMLGTLLGIGYLLRATTVLPMIAILFVMLYFGPRKKEMLFALLLGALLIFGVGRGNAALIGLDTTDTAFPATHWIMMSLTSPGAHNAQDEAFTASFPTKAEKRAAVRERMLEKLRQMSAGDIARLAAAKLKNTWGDGSNGYTVYLENCARTDGVYEAVFGARKDFVILYHQVYYLLLLALFLARILAGLQRPVPEVYLLHLTYLGGILFYLLWETSGQYSLPFLPVLLLAAAGGLPGGDREGAWRRESGGAGNKAWRHLDRRVGSLCYLFSALFVITFFLKSYPQLTGQPQPYEHAVVRQILANDELVIGGDDSFAQEFTTDQPFDSMIFQYTVPDSEADATFRAQLLDGGGQVLAQQDISTLRASARDAAGLSFPRVTPDGAQTYRLRISRISGDMQGALGVIVYSMGHYDANPTGRCFAGGEEVESDLLLAVSERRETVYFSRLSFAAGLLVLLIIVLLPIFGNLRYTIAIWQKDKMPHEGIGNGAHHAEGFGHHHDLQ